MVKVNISLMERANKKTKSDIVFLVATIVVMVVLFAIMALNVVFFRVKVSGASMEPTMQDGDVLVANRYKEPTHGSIVIISGENKDGDWIIKRVIAMEGDTVIIEPAEDGVFIKYAGTDEFVKIEETYIQGVTSSSRRIEKTLTKGEIFYLGDNRENSHDSRKEDYSTCDISQIEGVIEDWSFTSTLRFFI